MEPIALTQALSSPSHDNSTLPSTPSLVPPPKRKPCPDPLHILTKLHKLVVPEKVTQQCL